MTLRRKKGFPNGRFGNKAFMPQQQNDFSYMRVVMWVATVFFALGAIALAVGFLTDGWRLARPAALAAWAVGGTFAWLGLRHTTQDGSALVDRARKQADEAIADAQERAAKAIEAERTKAEHALAEVREERSAREAAEQRRAEMQRWALAMRERIQTLAHERGPLGDTHDVPSMILRIAIELLDAEKGLLLSRTDGDGDGTLDLLAAEGFENDPADSRIAERFARSVISKDETIRENDVEIPDGEKTSADREISNLVAIPIYIQDDFVGVVVVANKEGGFDEHEDEVLLALGDHAGALLQNTRLRGDLRLSYLTTIQILADALEAKDPFLRGHSNDVSAYVAAVAKHLDLEERRREELVFASLLHDLGKIGISERILLKPAALSPEEYNIVKLHPRIGFRLVEQVPALSGIGTAVLYHHERWDGRGYPDGLHGEEIPIEARIVAVADAFSAMTSDRPYRGRMPLEDALAELERGAGSQFDPQIVRLFCEELRNRPPIESKKSELAVALSDPQLVVRLDEDEPILGHGPYAIVDNLTLLYSHRYLHEMAKAEGERASVQKSSFSIVMAEVADIGEINARDGYAAGDAAIQKLAQAVQRVAVTCGGTAARYGGPRIALIIPKTTTEDAERCARELLSSVDGDPKVCVATAAWQAGEPGPATVARARAALSQGPRNAPVRA
jgi:diguanylate cyclase (GGDEF)-like protein